MSEFNRPESYVVSVRLNAEESKALTEAARFHGQKLSTYMKRMALSEARRPHVSIQYTARGDGENR